MGCHGTSTNAIVACLDGELSKGDRNVVGVCGMVPTCTYIGDAREQFKSRDMFKPFRSHNGLLR